jgi:hypothetical protein
MSKNKQQVITFKADAALADAISRLPNRSEFIRGAVLTALENTCPVCNGTGQLSPHQKEHWKEFMRDHLLEECSKCHEVHLVCGRAARARSARVKEGPQ